MSVIKVFIVDNYFLIREGIKKSLKFLEEVSIVGETHDLDNMIRMVTETQPNILILEINLCQKPLPEMMKELKIASPKTKVLVISDCDCELPVISSINAGISGFLKKSVSQDELIKAVKEISQGRDYFTSEVTKILMKGLSENSSAEILSEREREILKFICKGRSNEQIADILFLSEKTIATHKRNIMRKAKVKKTSELILWAFDNRVVIRN